ncbi:hypothetical protein Tco_1237964 [Tanacetum coccineum]
MPRCGRAILPSSRSFPPLHLRTGALSLISSSFLILSLLGSSLGFPHPNGNNHGILHLDLLLMVSLVQNRLKERGELKASIRNEKLDVLSGLMDQRGVAIVREGTATRVNLDESGATYDGNPKVISSPLVSLTATLIMPPSRTRMAFPVVEYYARNNWAKHRLKRIMMNNKGFFFFKFDSRAGLEVVLEGGPLLIQADLVDVVTIGISVPYWGGIYPKNHPVEYEWRPAQCGNSLNKDNITSSNSFSALNVEEEDEEEEVENVYDETANLFIKTGGSSFDAEFCYLYL